MGLEAQEMRGKTLNYLPSKQGVLLETAAGSQKTKTEEKRPITSE